jgi:hypothetical protein
MYVLKLGARESWGIARSWAGVHGFCTSANKVVQKQLNHRGRPGGGSFTTDYKQARWRLKFSRKILYETTTELVCSCVRCYGGVSNDLERALRYFNTARTSDRVCSRSLVGKVETLVKQRLPLARKLA